jgi:hypothetical protein
MLGEIVRATTSHAIAMAPHVRAIEMREVMDSVGLNVESALLAELDRSESSWSWIVDGEVACMFGIIRGHSLMDFAAYPWFLSTPLVEKHRMAFARACRHLLPELLRRHTCLSGMVDARHEMSVRWLKWLGAKIGDPQPWGIAGAPFHHFEIGG